MGVGGSVPGDGPGVPDGNPSRDTDGDGIHDDADNCPAVANPDQANEDGDRFGDACDPCPVVANDAPSDPDGDGVADECDPHPQTAGDEIVLFEGFAHGVPSGWSATPSSWSDAGGGWVRATAPVGKTAYLAPPIAPTSHETIATAVVLETLSGDNDNDAGVVLPYRSDTDVGVSCELYQPGAMGTGVRRVSLFDYVLVKELGAGTLPWTTNEAYVMTLTRTGASYVCGAAAATGGASATATGSTMSSVQSGKLALRAYAATARFAWVLVVASP